MSFKSYQDLEVWKKSLALSKMIYLLTQQFPKEELYGLSSQVKRCSLSVPSNIAEGHARNTSKEFIRFLYIALGSLAELETQTLFAKEMGFISAEELQTILEKTSEIGRMIRGLQKSIASKQTSP